MEVMVGSRSRDLFIAPPLMEDPEQDSSRLRHRPVLRDALGRARSEDPSSLSAKATERTNSFQGGEEGRRSRLFSLPRLRRKSIRRETSPLRLDDGLRRSSSRLKSLSGPSLVRRLRSGSNSDNDAAAHRDFTAEIHSRRGSELRGSPQNWSLPRSIGFPRARSSPLRDSEEFSLPSDSTSEEGLAVDEQQPVYLSMPRIGDKYQRPVHPSLLSPTEEEWDAYEYWMRHVVRLVTPIFEEESENGPRMSSLPLPRTLNMRLSIFLFFHRLEIPLELINGRHIATDKDWLKVQRGIMNSVVRFVCIPLDMDGSNSWWYNSPTHPRKFQPHRYYFVCHRVHTYGLPRPLSKKKLQEQEKLVFTQALISREFTPILTTLDPGHQKTRKRYMKWLVDFGINRHGDASPTLQLSALTTICRLAYPSEIVPGIREFFQDRTLLHTLLVFARRGEIEVHQADSMSRLEIEHVVGQGAVGKVCLAKRGLESVAVKITSVNNHALVEAEFRFELALMTVLRHPNILPCIAGNCSGSTFFIVTPFQSHGNLLMLLNEVHPTTWPQSRQYLIAKQIAQGMSFLHSHDIVHRDLKSENILVDENWQVRVADFGTSRFLGPQDPTKKMNMVGTTEYMAPEMVEGRYDFKVDVYSFAIILYEIFTGRTPYFEIVPRFGIIDHMLAGNRPIWQPEDNFAPEIREMIESCWHTNPSRRPSFRALVKFFNGWMREARRKEGLNPNDADVAPKPEVVSRQREGSTEVADGFGAKGFLHS